MRAIRASAPQPLAASDVGVMAVGLVAVLETAAACWLTQDAVFRGLGRPSLPVRRGRPGRADRGLDAPPTGAAGRATHPSNCR